MERGKLTERVYRGLRDAVVMLDDGDRRTLRALNLTPTQFDLLRLLDSDEPGAGGYTITKLAERLLCTRGNVTRLVRRLLDGGLVRIRSDSADQRLVKVYLTPEGMAQLTDARARHAVLNSDRFDAMSDTELLQLAHLLDQISSRLRTLLAS